VRDLHELLRTLRHDTLARAVIVLSDDGDILFRDAEAGLGLDALGQTAIARLGGVEGLASQIGGPEFAVLFHDTAGDDVHVSILDDEHRLCVLFSRDVVSLGTIRQRVRASRPDILAALSGQDDAS
jgi:hypothetical protein